MKLLLRFAAAALFVLGVHGAAPAADPPFRFYNVAATFTPSAPVRLSFRLQQTALDLTVGVVPLSLDEVLALLRNAADPSVVAAVRTGRRPMRIVRAHLEPKPDAPYTPQVVDVGVLPKGAYALRLDAAEKRIGVELAYVTSVGAIATGDGVGFTAMALDLQSMHARRDVTFTRYSTHGGGIVETVPADASGLAALDGAGTPEPDSRTYVVRAADGSYAVGSGDGRNVVTAAPSGYAQTDRPIYRPGDRVSYRIIVRDGIPGAFRIPRGERMVHVTNPDGKVIFSETRTFDAFGALSGEVPLPADATLGSYQVTTGEENDAVGTAFSVEAYKKPEYVVDVGAPALTIGGSPARFGVAARYFFGRPAAGMHLHYRAYFQDAYVWWRRGSPFGFAGYSPNYSGVTPPAVQGDAVADAAGRATLVIPTATVTAEKRLMIEVDARDEAGHTITAASTAQIVPASFYLTVASKTYFNVLGKPVDLTIGSVAYGTRSRPRPNTKVAVSFTRVTWDGRAVIRDAGDDGQSVVTDEHGTAPVRWTPRAGGYYEVKATSQDEGGRPVATTTGVWIASKAYSGNYEFRGTTVVPQKSEYAPGEHATLLVTAPASDVDALVQVSGGAAERIRVQRLATTTTAIDVEPPAGVEHYRVTVTVPTRSGFPSGTADVFVTPAHRLHVAVRPDKAKYGPGERARFALRVEDAHGQPVRAEVGLAVVDDAIFALRPASATDPYAAFYRPDIPFHSPNGSWNSVDEPQAAWLPLLLTIGRTQSRSATGQFQPVQTGDVYNTDAALTVAAMAPPGQPSFDKLRTDFRDTAYWSPSVVTGADGSALVTFAWPDSLTSYTASGVAVTAATDIGTGAGSALVSKDFLVRLATPRFLRRGDSAAFVALAQGTRAARSALLGFSAPDLGVGDETRTVRFDKNAGASARWNVRGGELGPASLRLAGTSGALRDGLRVTLPVETAGTAQHDRAAGMLPSASSIALRLPAHAEAGDLRIDLAPSIVAQLVASVRLSQVYPYYCVEQTMSAALPAVYVDRMRKRMTLPPVPGPAPGDVAKRAVDRLVQLQHGDGSWGWWENDPANPFMTAYALYGLTELAREGYAVPAATLDRGVKSVAEQINAHADTLALWGGAQPNSEWNTRAFMFYALANARAAAVDRTMLAQTAAHVKDLNSYAIAALGLAYVQLGDRTGAQPLLDELLRRVTDDGTYAQWKGNGWHYRWQDDPIETTAYALRFVYAMTPSDPRVARAVSWLRTQQHGSWFATTKDTAAAIFAISETVPADAAELNPHETVRVTLNGTVLKTLRVETAVLPPADASILVPSRLLKHGGTVRFERAGTGSLAWSTDWTRYVTVLPAAQLDPAFTIVRTYAAPGGNDWSVGDLIDVDLTVTTTSDAQYVAIEDPLPAGLEYQPRQHESGDDWSGLQFFDDRVVFFATTINRGYPLKLHYTLRASTAGTFTAPAPTAFAMYGPPLTAMGSAARIRLGTARLVQ